MRYLIHLVWISLLVSTACNRKNKPLATAQVNSSQVSEKDTLSGLLAMKPVLVFKTKADYRWNVPGLYNKEIKEIISYKAISDVRPFVDSGNCLPLINGYQLDLMGVSPLTIYFNYHLKEYAKLKAVPPIHELMNELTELSPVTEICHCKNLSGGEAYLRKRLNEIIAHDSLYMVCEKVY